MGWLSFILCLLASLWLVNRYVKCSFLSPTNFMLGFLVKLAFGFAYILLFTYYFANGSITGDSARFFTDSQIIQSIFHHSPSDFFRLIFGFKTLDAGTIAILENTAIWDVGPSFDWVNDNRIILKLNAFIHFFSFGNIYVHALIFVGLSFVGTVAIYKSFVDFVAEKRWFWWTIIAFPNLAFWGSSYLKEAIFILAFGLWCWSIKNLLKSRYKYSFMLVLAGALLLLNKPYAGAIIIGFSGIILVGHWLKWSLKGLAALSAITILLFSVIIIIPGKFNLTQKLSDKQYNFNNLAKGGIAFVTDSAFTVFPYHQLENFKRIGTDSIQVIKTTKGEYKLFGQPEFYPYSIAPSEKHFAVYLVYPPSNSYSPPKLINNSPWQLLKNSGSAMLNVFIRPFPTDSGDPLKNLNFLSNLALLAILFFAFFRRKSLSNQQQYIIFSLLGSALIIALIIGWSVPVFGAIVRYKIPVELLLIITAFIRLKSTRYVKN